MNINCYANYFFKTNYNNEKNKIKNHNKFNSQNYISLDKNKNLISERQIIYSPYQIELFKNKYYNSNNNIYNDNLLKYDNDYDINEEKEKRKIRISDYILSSKKFTRNENKDNYFYKKSNNNYFCLKNFSSRNELNLYKSNDNIKNKYIENKNYKINLIKLKKLVININNNKNFIYFIHKLEQFINNKSIYKFKIKILNKDLFSNKINAKISSNLSLKKFKKNLLNNNNYEIKKYNFSLHSNNKHKYKILYDLAIEKIAKLKDEKNFENLKIKRNSYFSIKNNIKKNKNNLNIQNNENFIIKKIKKRNKKKDLKNMTPILITINNTIPSIKEKVFVYFKKNDIQIYNHNKTNNKQNNINELFEKSKNNNNEINNYNFFSHSNLKNKIKNNINKNDINDDDNIDIKNFKNVIIKSYNNKSNYIDNKLNIINNNNNFDKNNNLNNNCIINNFIDINKDIENYSNKNINYIKKRNSKSNNLNKIKKSKTSENNFFSKTFIYKSKNKLKILNTNFFSYFSLKKNNYKNDKNWIQLPFSLEKILKNYHKSYTFNKIRIYFIKNQKNYLLVNIINNREKKILKKYFLKYKNNVLVEKIKEKFLNEFNKKFEQNKKNDNSNKITKIINEINLNYNNNDLILKKRNKKLSKIISKNLKLKKYLNLWKELITNKNNNNYKILHIKFVKNKRKMNINYYNNLNKSAINFNNKYDNNILKLSKNFLNINPLFKSTEEIYKTNYIKLKNILFNIKLKKYFNKWKNFNFIKSKKIFKKQFTKYFLMYLINTFSPFNFENNNYILGKYSYLWYHNINKN